MPRPFAVVSQNREIVEFHREFNNNAVIPPDEGCRLGRRSAIQTSVIPQVRTIDLELLDRKMKRLVNRLKKHHNIQLEVFNHDDIEYGEVIGKGGEGVVQKCTVLYNDLPVSAAVKTFVNNSDDALNITLYEIELLCLARDPIVSTTLQVYGIAAMPDKLEPTKGHLVIITEVGLKNALQLYQDETVPLHLTLDVWSRLAAALHCMHRKNIIHQDLKPENILITRIIRDTLGHIDKLDFRVIDLGMAQLVENDRVYTEDILGTTGYHAPEVLFDDDYDLRADIFVLGITFCVMLLPRSMLKKKELRSILQNIHDAKKNHRFGRDLFESVIEPTILLTISDSVKNMICCMLETVRERSITLLEITRLCDRESTRLDKESCRGSPMYRFGASTQMRDSGIDSTSVDVPSHKYKRVECDPATGFDGRLRSKAGVRTRCTRRNRSASFSSCATVEYEGEDDQSGGEEMSEEEEEEEPIGRRTRNAKGRSLGGAMPSRGDADRS